MLLFVRNFARRRVAARSPRRSRIWVGTTYALGQLAGGSATQFTALTEANLEAQGKPTIARVRGQIMVQMDRSAEVSEDKVLVGMGLFLAEARQVAVGVTAMPLPITSSDFSWMWYHVSCLSSPTTLTEDEGNGQRFERIVIDNKAMRKAGPNQVLVFVIEAFTITGAPDVEVFGHMRFLLLPS